MPEEYMLSTIDNPYDPFEPDEFDKWLMFDTVDHDYNSGSLLARIFEPSNKLSEPENIRLTNEAIDFILDHDLTGMRIKVKRKTKSL